MIWGEPSAWNHTMHMGMSEQRLSPSVRNSEKSDLGAEVFGISGDLEKSLGRGTKE